jgi:DNA-directed RNA polymerase I subunit RPA2
MERDALIAHGTSYLLQDRLMNCSDYSTAWVCRTCGSMISLGFDDVKLGQEIGARQLAKASTPSGEYCRVCRAEAEEEDTRARRELNGEQSYLPSRDNSLSVALPAQNVFGRAKKGCDMDVVAIPFVFRYLCAELASMGINVSVEIKS